MPRAKKKELERIADMILLDDAIKKNYVKGTKNRHGLGKYMRERGMINAAWESEIAAHEKTNFNQGQLEELAHNGPDRRTRERYKKVE